MKSLKERNIGTGPHSAVFTVSVFPRDDAGERGLGEHGVNSDRILFVAFSPT